MHILLFMAVLLLSGCTIDPPLHLPYQDVLTESPEVVLDIEVIWHNTMWKEEFIYGWDAADIKDFGELNYPEPIDYNLRRYYLGLKPGYPHVIDPKRDIMDGNSYRDRYEFGYHDILVWSRIHTDNNTQSVIITEELESVDATTSYSSQSNQLGQALLNHTRATTAMVHNQPDIFYSGYLRDLYVSRNTADYDYYDSERRVWVKKVDFQVQPLVFIYVVQVLLRNNHNRILGLNSGAAIAGLADGTNVNFGTTTTEVTNVDFDMRLKSGITITDRFATPLTSGYKTQAQPGEVVDVIGGKLTTFGLCGMPGFLQSPDLEYAGTCPENDNLIALDFSFRNGTDSVYTFDLSNQLKHQCHGGVLTIEINVDDIPIPTDPSSGNGGSGFDPWVENYGGDESHEISM